MENYEFEVIYPEIKEPYFGLDDIIIKEKNSGYSVYINARIGLENPDAIEIVKQTMMNDLKNLTKQ